MDSDVDGSSDNEVDPEVETVFSDGIWVLCNVEENAVDSIFWVDV